MNFWMVDIKNFLKMKKNEFQIKRMIIKQNQMKYQKKKIRKQRMMNRINELLSKKIDEEPFPNITLKVVQLFNHNYKFKLV